jgi:hypothetical protein
VAWAYYCKKQYQEALPYLQTALKTHSQNPELLYHAGLIYAGVGKRVSKGFLKALKINAGMAVY